MDEGCGASHNEHRRLDWLGPLEAVLVENDMGNLACRKKAD